MGCNCVSKLEESEIQKNEGMNNSNNEFQTIQSYHKNLLLGNRLMNNNDIFQTISNKNTINIDENISKKNTIEIMEKEDDDSSFEENIEDTPSDEFSKYIFSQINLLRSNPGSFVGLIKNSESNVILDAKNRLIYKTKLKVALNKGIKAFEEAKLILSDTKPMDKLIYDHDMKLSLPKKEINIKSKEFLRRQVLKKAEKGIDIKAYWKEVIYEPETCFVLMIVDDSGIKAGFKRRNLLNPEYKYIGIGSKMINKKFVCYISLR